MRKLILRNSLSPGDIVMLTAAVRDLHLTFPGRFLTDVRTSCAERWEHNPYLTPLDESDPEVEDIHCEYPLIHQSNHLPYHFIHGIRLFLCERLGVDTRPHALKGDVHLTDQEKGWLSQVDEITGAAGTRFWIVVSGGKTDFTNKWWDPDRKQAVVDQKLGDSASFAHGQELLLNHRYRCEITCNNDIVAVISMPGLTHLNDDP